jgi:hypothetical protein
MLYLKKPVLWLTSCLVLSLGLAMPLHAAQSVTLYMTVDWEGWSLDDENLQAMRDFRVRYSHIPMLHLLNHVYFLRPGADAKAMTEKMRSAFLPADGQGLHLHGWQSLVEACGLEYRNEPAFSGPEGSCSADDCGYNVSLELAYSEPELERLVSCSTEKLVQQGFGRPKHFRAGGWQLGPKLALALQVNGFEWDSSRIDHSLLLGKWHPDSGLVTLLKQLHSDATPMDQPRQLLPGLMQYPNNAALADYTNAVELTEIFIALVEQRKTVMVLGFHQETADHYLPRLEEAIKLMEQESAKRDVKLVWAGYR